MYNLYNMCWGPQNIVLPEGRTFRNELFPNWGTLRNLLFPTGNYYFSILIFNVDLVYDCLYLISSPLSANNSFQGGPPYYRKIDFAVVMTPSGRAESPEEQSVHFVTFACGKTPHSWGGVFPQENRFSCGLGGQVLPQANRV